MKKRGFAGEDTYNARSKKKLVYHEEIEGLGNRAFECKRFFGFSKQQNTKKEYRYGIKKFRDWFKKTENQQEPNSS